MNNRWPRRDLFSHDVAPDHVLVMAAPADTLLRLIRVVPGGTALCGPRPRCRPEAGHAGHRGSSGVPELHPSLSSLATRYMGRLGEEGRVVARLGEEDASSLDSEKRTRRRSTRRRGRVVARLGEEDASSLRIVAVGHTSRRRRRVDRSYMPGSRTSARSSASVTIELDEYYASEDDGVDLR